MSIVTLAGWGQPYDALKSIAPNAHHIDYASAGNREEIFALIEKEARNAQTIIGWSLGGQLAARAIAAGLIKPRRLVLLATPYQFVESDGLKLGMSRDTFAQFSANLAADATRTLKKSYALVAHGDAREEQVRAQLGEAQTDRNWLKWLTELSLFTSENLDFAGFPPTLLVHGKRDVVVHPDQSRMFAQRIPGARLELWENAAHAPHLHDPEKLLQLMAEHAK